MDSFLGLDLSRNYSFFTVPAAFFIAALPHTYAVSLSRPYYDNTYPRNLNQVVTNCDALDKETRQRILRAQAAMENGFETLGFYAAGVVAANVTGVPVGSLNALTLSYVVSRVLYNIAYIWIGTNRKRSGLRSLIWVAGISIITTLWVKAGNRALAQ